MRICFLSSMHPATDKRVHYKEAVSLLRAGHEVFHVAPDDGDDRLLDGVKLITYRGRRNLAGRLRQLGHLFRLARRLDVDCYHCNELDSWLVGLALKLVTRRRVVLDIHELYSTTFPETWLPPYSRPPVVALIRLLYRALLPLTDYVVLAKHGAELELGQSRVRRVLVRNFAELGDCAPSAAPAGWPDEPSEPAPARTDSITAVHLGSINRSYGWPQMLGALAATRNRSIRLRVIGRFGDDSEPEFRDRVAALGIGDRVTFEGWIDYREVPDALRACDIGISALQPVFLNYVHALPHKMFDYMAVGLPIIVPDFTEEVSRIVRQSECGLIVDTTRPESIAAALDQLAADPALRRRLGENGRRAVLTTYNWRREAENLIRMYGDLGRLGGRRSEASRGA